MDPGINMFEMKNLLKIRFQKISFFAIIGLTNKGKYGY